MRFLQQILDDPKRPPDMRFVRFGPFDVLGDVVTAKSDVTNDDASDLSWV